MQIAVESCFGGELASFIRSGLLDLSRSSTTEFPLSDANEAVTHAASNARPFHLTLIRP